MITTLFYSNEIHASPDTPAHVRIDIVNSGSTVARPQLDVLGLPEGWVAPIEPIPELPPNQSWSGEISFTIPVAASHGRHLAMVRLVDAATGETCGTNRITLMWCAFEGAPRIPPVLDAPNVTATEADSITFEWSYPSASAMGKAPLPDDN